MIKKAFRSSGLFKGDIKTGILELNNKLKAALNLDACYEAIVDFKKIYVEHNPLVPNSKNEAHTKLSEHRTRYLAMKRKKELTNTSSGSWTVRHMINFNEKQASQQQQQQGMMFDPQQQPSLSSTYDPQQQSPGNFNDSSSYSTTSRRNSSESEVSLPDLWLLQPHDSTSSSSSKSSPLSLSTILSQIEY